MWGSKLRIGLRALIGVSTVGAAVATVFGALPIAGILALVATHAGAVLVELPREPWTDEKRAASSRPPDQGKSP